MVCNKNVLFQHIYVSKQALPARKRERSKNIDDCMIFQEADDKIQSHDITICFFNRYFNGQEYAHLVDVADQMIVRNASRPG